MQIPPERLTPDTLRAVIEEFVTREGTDYGHQDYHLAQKVARVRQQLSDGQAIIYFDERLQSIDIRRHDP